MGGFFGVAVKKNAAVDVYFGTDYHSHLGSSLGGIAMYDEEKGLQRAIHHIGSTPFRAKFEHVFNDMKGNSAIGCISDKDPQPILIRSNIGTYAICAISAVNNLETLLNNFLAFSGGHINAMTGGKINATELIASLINQKSNFVDGIKFAQDRIDGTASIMILKDNGHIIVARDKLGRLPVMIGKNEDGYCISFESFAYQKLDYEDFFELKPAEIVEVSSSGIEVLSKGESKCRICSFLWSYYGYPTSTYEGKNVEIMRYKNGRILARYDKDNMDLSQIDYVGGVPDSGTPHAIGYANESGRPFARAFIKYTPTWSRSFIPSSQKDRQKVAKMKQIPVNELITDKTLLLIDDSIVRGTQIGETVDFLYENGAKEVHMRSAAPPIMYPCRYLNFSRTNSEMELITRRVIMELEGDTGLKYIDEYSDANTERGKNMRKAMCEKLHLKSIGFQSLEGLIEAIGLKEENLCTYCRNKKV